MKKYLLLSYILILSFTSCSEDTPIENVLNGTIDNNPFTVGQSTYTEVGSDSYEFNVFSNNFTTDDACIELPAGIRIFFKSNNSTERQDLFLDVNSFEAFTVSIISEDQSKNIIATKGFFQILDINNDIITGNLEIEADSNTSIEGTFTALLCE